MCVFCLHMNESQLCVSYHFVGGWKYHSKRIVTFLAWISWWRLISSYLFRSYQLKSLSKRFSPCRIFVYARFRSLSSFALYTIVRFFYYFHVYLHRIYSHCFDIIGTGLHDVTSNNMGERDMEQNKSVQLHIFYGCELGKNFNFRTRFLIDFLNHKQLYQFKWFLSIIIMICICFHFLVNWNVPGRDAITILHFRLFHLWAANNDICLFVCRFSYILDWRLCCALTVYHPMT